MAAEYATSLEPAKVNSLDGLCVTPARIDVIGIVRDAVAAGASAHKSIAADVQYQPDYWSRVLTGERGITLDRLGRLPLDVQAGIVIGWSNALGLKIERRDRQQSRVALQALAQTLLVVAEGL